MGVQGAEGGARGGGGMAGAMSRPGPHAWDVVNRHRAWFTSLSAYMDLTWGEYCRQYEMAREVFNSFVEAGDMQAAFTTTWCLYRQPFYHRWSQWPEVAARVPDGGSVLDWGCGTGEMLAWLQRHSSARVLHGYDLESPHFAYAKWRLWHKEYYALTDNYDVIVCQETLEHVEECVEVAQKLMGLVKPGGVLMWDFIDAYDGGANCAAPAARKEVLRLLKAANDGQREVWRKPPG